MALRLPVKNSLICPINREKSDQLTFSSELWRNSLVESVDISDSSLGDIPIEFTFPASFSNQGISLSREFIKEFFDALPSWRPESFQDLILKRRDKQGGQKGQMCRE